MKQLAFLSFILIVFIVAVLYVLMQPKKVETLPVPLIQAASSTWPSGGKG